MSYNDYLKKQGGVIANSSDPYSLQIDKLKKESGLTDRTQNIEDGDQEFIDKGMYGGFDETYRSDLRANQQSTGKKWANAFGKMGILAGTTFADATIGTIWGIGESLFNFDDGSIPLVNSKIWDNQASNFFQDINKKSEKWMPLHQTSEEQDTKWYKRMVTPGMVANFWGDTVFKNFGFTIGAIMGGAAISGGASKTLGNIFSKKISGELGKALASNPEDAMKVFAKYGVGGSDDLVALGAKDPMIGNQILQELKTSANVIKNINTTSSAMGLVGSAMGEGRIEAINGKEQLHEQLLADGYSAEDAERLSLASGNIQFAANVALLSLSNYAQFGKMFGFNNRSAAQALVKGNFKEAGEFAVKNQSKAALGARVFINPFTEANEEMSQAWAEEFSHDIVLRRNDKHAQGFVDDIIDSSIESFNNSYGNVDRWEEGFAGFITGFVGLPNVSGIKSKIKTGKGSVWSGGVAGELMENSDNRTQAGEYAKVLNQIKSSTDFQEYYKKAVVNASYEQDKEIATEANDNNAFAQLNTEQLITDLNAVINTGKYDEFVGVLEANKSLTGVDIKASAEITKGKDGELLKEPIQPLKNKTDKEVVEENVANLDYLLKKAKQTRDLKEQIDTRLAYMGLSNTTILGEQLLLDGVMMAETNEKADKIAENILKEINSLRTSQMNRNPIESAKYATVSTLTVDDLREVYDIKIPLEVLQISDPVKRNQAIEDFLNSSQGLNASLMTNLEKLLEGKFSSDIKFSAIDKKKKKDLTAEEDLARIFRDNYIKAVTEFSEKKSSNNEEVMSLIKTESARKRFVKNYRDLNKDLVKADKKVEADKQKLTDLETNQKYSTTSKEEKKIMDAHEAAMLKIDPENFDKQLLLIGRTVGKLQAIKTNPSVEANINKLMSLREYIEGLKAQAQAEENDNQDEPIIYGKSALSEIYDDFLTDEQKAAKEQVLLDIPLKAIQSAYYIKVEDETHDTDGFALSKRHSKVSFIKGNRLGKSVNVYLNLNKLPGAKAGKDLQPMLIGSLLDPTRFADKAGRRIDVTNPIVLQNISDGLVAGKKLTKKGEDFVLFYHALDVAWDALKDGGDTKALFNINRKDGFRKLPLAKKITDEYTVEQHGIEFGYGKAIYLSDEVNTRIFKITADNKKILLNKEADLGEIQDYKNYLNETSTNLFHKAKVKGKAARMSLADSKASLNYQYSMVVMNGLSHVLIGLGFPKAASKNMDLASIDESIHKVFDAENRGKRVPVMVNGSYLSFLLGDKKEKKGSQNSFHTYINMDTTPGEDENGNLVEDIVTFNINVTKGYGENPLRHTSWHFSKPKLNGRYKLVAMKIDNEIRYFEVDNDLLGTVKNGKFKSHPPSKIKNAILEELNKLTNVSAAEVSHEHLLAIFTDYLKENQFYTEGEFTVGDAIVEVDKSEKVDDFTVASQVFIDLIIHPTGEMFAKAKARPQKTASKIKKKVLVKDEKDDPNDAGYEYYNKKAIAIHGTIAYIKNGKISVFADNEEEMTSLLEDAETAYIRSKNETDEFERTTEQIAEGLEAFRKWYNKTFNKRTKYITRAEKDTGTKTKTVKKTKELITRDDVGQAVGDTAAENKKTKDDDSDNDPFSGNESFTFDGFGDIETFEEAEARLKQLVDLPTKRIANLVSNGNALGVFFKGAIGLRDNVAQSVKYHEAFHAVFRMYLDESEVQEYLGIAKRKFGKPTSGQLALLAEQINAELKRGHGLTDQELENLWYEEQIADEFSKYAVTKDNATGLEKLYNIIRDFLKRLFKQNLDVLFQDIYHGKFKSKQQRNNSLKRNVPAFKIFSHREGKSYHFIDNKKSSLIINNIAENIFNNGLTVYDETSFNNALKVTLEAINPEQYRGDVDDLKLLIAEGEYNDIVNVINNNILDLQKEVKGRLALYSIEAVDSLDDLVENSDIANFHKSVFETGGWASTSKRVKAYFGFTRVYNDIYGLDLPNKVEYYLNTDPVAMYQFLERNLAGTLYQKLFKKLDNIAKVNDDLAYMFTQMIENIAEETKLDQVTVKKALLAGQYETLVDSPLFNDLVNAFYKDKANFYISILDAQTGETSFFNANENGADKTIVQEWSNDHSNLNIRTKDKIKFITKTVDDIETNLRIEKGLDNTTAVNSQTEILYNLFKRLGITLSRDYLKWNLLKSNKHVDYLRDFYDAHDNAEGITNLEGTDILERIKSYVNNPAFNAEDSLGIFTTKKEVDKKGKTKEDSIISIMRKLARNNILFDKTITESTFTNGEGKQIFDKVHPSYLFETLNYYSKLQESEIGRLQTIINDGDKNALIVFYSEVMNSQLGNYEAIMLLEMLASNPMFKGAPSLVKFFLSNLDHAVHDSFKEKDTENLFKRTNLARSFKKLDTITSELFSMGAYANIKTKTYIDKDGDAHDYEFAWVHLGQNEGKSTTISVLMPIDTGISTLANGRAIGELNSLLMHEVESIARVKKEIKILDEEGIVEFAETHEMGYSEAYHGTFEGKTIDQSTSRGLKMFNFPAIFNNLTPDYTLDSIIPGTTLEIVDKDTQKYKEIAKLPFTERINALIDANIISSKSTYNLGKRFAIIVNVDGIDVPFYRSSEGTGGKQKGSWTPFFGFGKSKGNDWLIKGSIEQINNNYNSDLIKKYSDILNNTLNWDHALDKGKVESHPYFKVLNLEKSTGDFNKKVYGVEDLEISNHTPGATSFVEERMHLVFQEEAFSAIGPTIEDGITVRHALAQMLEKEFSDYKEFLIENNLMDKDGKSDYIPNHFRVEHRKVSMAKLKDYLINDYLSTFKFNLLLHGNFAANFKNVDDIIKRNARIIANGTTMRQKQINFSILRSKSELISEFDSIRTGIDEAVVGTDKQGDIDSTDAQSFGTTTFAIKFLQSAGKVPTEVKEILERIEKGLDLIQPITDKELSILEKNNATLQPKKVVQGGMFSYWKTSLHTVTVSQVAVINPDYTDGMSEAATMDLIRKTFNKGDFNKLFGDIFMAKEGREESFLLLKEVYNKSLDFVTFDSAIKTFKSNVNDTATFVPAEVQVGDTSSFYIQHSQIMDGHTIREQLSTDGFKDSVPHSVQTQQLIWSEQDEAQMSFFMKNPIAMPKLIKAYDALIIHRIKNGFEKTLIPKLFTIAHNGKLSKAKWNDLMAHMETAIAQTSDDPYINILFSELDGRDPEFSLDFPVIQKKFQALYLAYVSKQVFAHKVKGNKYTLVSDYGTKIPRILKKIADSFANLDMKNISDEEMSTYIEAPDNSGIYQVLNDTTGATHTMRHRLRHRVWDPVMETYYSEIIVSDRVLQKLKVSVGDTIRPELLMQLGVRIPTQDKHSMAVMKIVATDPAYMGNFIKVPYEIVKLSGADFDVDALYGRAFDYFQDETGKQILFGDYLTESNVDKAMDTAHTEYIMSYHNSHKAYGEYPIEYGKFKTDLKGFMKIKAFVLLHGGLDLSGFTKSEEYGKVVKSNRKIFQLSKKDEINDLHKIQPLSLEETNNLLLRLEMQMVNNNGNKKIAATPASMSTIKETNGKIEKAGIVRIPKTNSFSRHNKMVIKEGIQTGNDLIAPAALFNVTFQQLVKYKIPTETYFGASGFTSLLGDDNKRINDMISEIISSMTDNAKEQDAANYNLTKESLTAVLTLIGIGVDKETVLLMAKQPAIKFVVKYFSLLNSPLDTEIKKEMRKVKDNPEALAGYLIKKFKETNKIPTGTTTSGTPSLPSKENLMDNLEEITDASMQLEVMSEFLRLIDYSTKIQNLASLTGFTKNLKSSFDEIQLESAFKALDLVIVEDTEGYKLDNYTISSPNGSPFLPIFKDKESVMRTKVIAAHLTEKISDNFFITLSKPYKKIYSAIAKTLKVNAMNYSDTKYSINEAIIARLMSYNPKNEINPEILFDDTIVKSYGILQKAFKNNKFLRDLRIDEIEFKKTNGRTFNDLKVNSWTSNNPNYVAEMLSSFEELYASVGKAGNFTHLTNLMRYLAVRNGLTFKNGSFIKFISPDKFGWYHNRLKALRTHMADLTANPQEIADILNMSLEQFMYEVSYIYGTNEQNVFNLRYNDTGISKSITNPVVRNAETNTISVNSSYGINFNETNEESSAAYKERIRDGKTNNFNSIAFLTSIGTTNLNNKTLLNNPTVLKIKKIVYTLQKTATYVTSKDNNNKGAGYWVRDFEKKTKTFYLETKANLKAGNSQNNVADIIVKLEKDKSAKMDFITASDIAEFRKTQTFKYGNVLTSDSWALDKHKIYSIPLEKEEEVETKAQAKDKKEQKKITEAVSMDDLGELISLMYDNDAPSDTKQVKPKVLDSSKEEKKSLMKIKLTYKLAVKHPDNKGYFTMKDLLEIFEKEGDDAVQEHINKCMGI